MTWTSGWRDRQFISLKVAGQLDYFRSLSDHYQSIDDGRANVNISRESPDLLPGTLDLLILGTLAHGSKHGYAIAEHLKSVSNEVLQVGESSLYPALQRLLLNGWVKAEWGASENNRRARYYTLTTTGRKQLRTERGEFDRMILAIQKVLESV
jgi:PadR family transcriptional regulator